VTTTVARQQDQSTGYAMAGGRGTPAIGDPGRAARELTAGLPPRLPAVPDHVLAEHCTAGLAIRAASIRGLMHRHRDQPRQDGFAVAHEVASDTTLVVVCDGVGSFPRSHEAAEFVTERLPVAYWEHRDWDTAIAEVNAELRELSEQAARDNAGSPAMATTVVAVAIERATRGYVAHIAQSDDSTVWRLAPDGEWSAGVAEPAAAEGAPHSGSVRGLPATPPHIHHSEISFDCGALFVMTDGVALPLTIAAEVRDTLAEWWSSAPPIFEFGQQVGFARKSHLDDRTVVGVWVVPPDEPATTAAAE
jgi:hypothetical protein